MQLQKPWTVASQLYLSGTSGRAMRRILAIIGMCISLAGALAPPHPDLLQDESLEDHPSRRRLSEQHDSDYSTRLLNPMVCQGLSVEECQEMDNSFVNQTQRTRRIMQQSGTVKTLIVLIKFPDHNNRNLPSASQIEDLFHYTGTSDTVPTGSVAEFLRINSYDQFQLETTILDWTVTDNTEKYYTFNMSGLTPDLGYAMHPILNAYEAKGFDFSQFDTDGDGVIDSLFLLHSGYAAEIGGEDCYSKHRHLDRVWSHAIGGSPASWKSADGRIRTGTYMVTAAQRGTCDNQVARIGVLTHELLHTIGLPDLYDGNWIGNGLGVYDIMSNPYGIDGGQTFPAHLSPWCKMELGWLDPIVISKDGEYKALASATTQEVYRLDFGFPSNEYILIENRQPLFWDAQLYDGGLLIYHIDDNVPNYNMNSGFPGQSGWPWNGNHYRVALIQADRSFDLEKGFNAGERVDFFSEGRQLGPAPIYEGQADPALFPNTNSYQNGIIEQTGVHIYDISEVGPEMSFQIWGVAPGEPTASPTPVPTQSPTPRPTLRPTNRPTPAPTPNPTQNPTPSPSPRPSLRPTKAPTPSPTLPPTPSPTPSPTQAPTASPTPNPTPPPTIEPTLPPTPEPTPAPTNVPTSQPTPLPTSPTPLPTPFPTNSPTPEPTLQPTRSPRPSQTPSFLPTTSSKPTITAGPTADEETLESGSGNPQLSDNGIFDPPLGRSGSSFFGG